MPNVFGRCAPLSLCGHYILREWRTKNVDDYWKVCSKTDIYMIPETILISAWFVVDCGCLHECFFTRSYHRGSSQFDWSDHDLWSGRFPVVVYVMSAIIMWVVVVLGFLQIKYELKKFRISTEVAGMERVRICRKTAGYLFWIFLLFLEVHDNWYSCCTGNTYLSMIPIKQ